jgi:hypothetical protein
LVSGATTSRRTKYRSEDFFREARDNLKQAQAAFGRATYGPEIMVDLKNH